MKIKLWLCCCLLSACSLQQKRSSHQRTDSISKYNSTVKVSALRNASSTLNILDSSVWQEQFRIFPKGKFYLSKDGYEGEADLILISNRQKNTRNLNATKAQNKTLQVAQVDVGKTKYQSKQQISSNWKINNSLFFWLGFGLLVLCAWRIRKKINNLLK